MKIKVCGLKDPKNMQEIDALHPDFVGLIFYPKSPRFIGGEIFPNTTAKKVGVFVETPVHYIVRQAEKHQLDYIQLHGKESLEKVKSLYEKGFQLIKVFSVGPNFDFSVTADFEPYCAYFLFDTQGEKPGGNGLQFNWEMLQTYSSKTPFLLSGGIGPADVEQIKKFAHPAWRGIDVNSGFESKPGVKNNCLLKKFIDEINA